MKAFGKKGVIIEQDSLAALRQKHHLPPIVEISLEHLSEPPRYFPSPGDLHAEYQKHGKFGDFGDLISYRETRWCGVGGYVLEWIAPLAYPKAALAADLIPFIEDSDGRLFFVGIKRGRPPGVGKQALIGGFRAIEQVDTPHGPTHMLETPLENLMHECGEESGIMLSDLLLTSPSPYNVDAVAHVTIPELGISSLVNIHAVGTVRTDVGVERNATTGEMRVHETTGYMFVVHVDRPLTAEAILATLKPTDKTEGTVPMVLEVTDHAAIAAVRDGFHAVHHRQLYGKAIRTIQVNRLLSSVVSFGNLSRSQ